MIIFRTQTTVQICGTKNAWSLESDDSNAPRTETLVNLEIQGSTRDGYNLVMLPDGFFTADYWYETIDEAFEAGFKLFSISKGQWEEILKK